MSTPQTPPSPASKAARNAILDRLRRAQGVAPPTAPDCSYWQPVVPLPAEPLPEIFCRQIGAAHAEVHRVTHTNWLETLGDCLTARQISHLLLGCGTGHAAEAAATLPARGIDCPRYDSAIEGWKDRLFHHIEASLTLARAAIAETGTLILWPDANEPRLMSLVPPLHIVLLDADRIHPTFAAMLKAEQWGEPAAPLPTNALLISGPSKTADIQQTLAYGAHGPRELIVLLREAQP